MINPDNRTLNEKIVDSINNSFSGVPWHGKSLMSILATTDQQLSPRVLALVNHIVAWRLFVVNALNGIEQKIELDSLQDWPPVEQDQEEIIKRLINSQDQLVSSIKNFDASKWRTKPGGAEYTYQQLCRGIRDHDIYHSAQIATAIRQSQV